MNEVELRSAFAQALAVCRAAAASPIPSDDAIAHLRSLLPEMPEDEAREAEAAILVLQAVGAVQAIGLQVSACEERPERVTIPRQSSNALLIPSPPGLRF